MGKIPPMSMDAGAYSVKQRGDYIIKEATTEKTAEQKINETVNEMMETGIVSDMINGKLGGRGQMLNIKA